MIAPAHLNPIRVALNSCRSHMQGIACFSALVNVLYIAPTLYMLQVYDRVLPTRGVQTLFFLTLVVLFSLATLALLDRVRSRLLVRMAIKLDAKLAPTILDASIGRPDLITARQALRDFDTIRGTLTGPGVLAALDAPWVPIYVIACFLLHPWIGAVAVLGCTVLPLIAWANERATSGRLNSAQRIAADSYANQDAILGAADTVRALGMRSVMVFRQLRQRGAMVTAQTEASFATGGYLATTKFVRMMLQSIALGLGALLAIDNKISGGVIFASSFLIARALAPIEQLISAWKPLVLGWQSYVRISGVLATAPTLRTRTRLPIPTGGLVLEGLTVLNETRESAIVTGVSFSLAPGEVVAIVGPSGAGKSTMVRAISGAVVADRGTVRIDNAEAKDWDPEELARYIGYLPQDSVLFAGSVAENISRFRAETHEDRGTIDANVVAAAEAVGAGALIARLPGGYDYQLKLGGRGVSAGEAQRIALARAVYENPKILILDEPNAHLDAEGDAALVAALATLKARGCTILIVSHKLGILSVVDKVLLLRAGRIEMFGPRDEVLPRLMPTPIRQVVPLRRTENL